MLDKGREVTVVEMLPELAVDMGSLDRQRLLLRITSLPITLLTGAKCSGVQKDGATIITSEGKEQLIRADTVVLAVGMKPENSLLPLLKANGFETHLAGDCWHVKKIAYAIDDGSRLGRVL